jgi:HlyD family secretion protein
MHSEATMASPDTGVAMDRPTERKRPVRRWLIGSAVLVPIALILYTFVLSKAERTVRVDARGVTVATVENALFRDVTAIRTTAVPRDIVILDAQEGGRVDRVLAQVGDVVTAGQTLVQFGNTDLQLQVIEREARLIEQVNNLRSIETGLEQARAANTRALEDIQYNISRLRRLGGRVRNLAASGATSAESSESLSDELAYYERVLPIAEETARRQEALRVRRIPEIDDALQRLLLNLSIVRAKLDSLVVRAPVSGRLTGFDLRVGQNRDRGTRLAEIVPDTGFKLEAVVDEFYLGRMRPGQKAQVALGAETHALRVTRVDPQVRDGRVRIELEFEASSPPDVVSGQSMQGELQLGNELPALVLPTGAFLETTGGRWIFVLDADGANARRREIEIGRRNAEQVELVRGLAAGERVIVSSYQELTDAQRIELRR